MKFYKNRGYVVVIENIKFDSEIISLKQAYSWPDLYYIGTTLNAYRLWKKYGITEFYPPRDYIPRKEYDDKTKVKKLLRDESTLDFKTKPCLIGWSSREQKWYGWARAIYGFEQGSTVKKGDIGYIPSNKEDFIENILYFWEFDKNGNWIPYSSHNEDDNVIKKVLDKLEIDVINTLPEWKGKVGIQMEYTTFVKDDRKELKSSHFSSYPDEYGKGEWTAVTMEDAKKMAADFALGCA